LERLEDRLLLAADLKIVAHSTPSEVILGQTLPVSFTIKNDGDAATSDTWYDNIYLSFDDTYDFDDAFIDQVTHAAPLGPGEELAVNKNVRFGGDPAVIGDVYVIYSIDEFNYVDESNEFNNRLATPIVTSAPDLALSNVSAPATATLGSAIQISARVTNISSTTRAPAFWTDALYLSEDAIFDPYLDTSFGYQGAPVSPLNPGEFYDYTNIPVLLPQTAAGSKYLIFVADAFNSQPETSEANNFVVQPITVSGPDLFIQTANAPTEAEPGETIDISYTVKNQGDLTASLGWTDRVYFSDYPEGGFDIELLTQSITSQSPLAADGTYTINAQITLPANSGRGLHYLRFVTDEDGDQGETADANNERVIPIDLGRADLRITSLIVPPAVTLGAPFDVTYTIINAGRAPTDASSWYDRFILSADATVDDNDTIVNESIDRFGDPLLSNASYTKTVSLTILDPTQTTLIVEADGFEYQSEANENNNRQSATLVIAAPDLLVQDFQAPVSATLGDTIHISFTVKNQGNVATAQNSYWYDSLKLSDDDVFDNADSYLLDLATLVPALAPGESYLVEQDILINHSSMAGNVFLCLKTDAGGYLSESDENNNVTSRAISIAGPDLALTLNSAPASAVVGDVIHVSFTVENIAALMASGSWYDYVYLSEDNSYDDTDTILASLGDYHAELAAGDSYSTAVDFMLPVTYQAGSKFLIFRADGTEGQGEINEANNIVVWPITIHAPDLVVTDAQAPSEVQLGELISITYTVTNQNSSPALADWYDSYYLSADSVFDLSDTWIGYESITSPRTPLAGNASYTITRDLQLPGNAPALNFLLIITDNYDNQGESNKANNARAVPIQGQRPDLIVSDSASPVGAIAGDTISISYDVKNIGEVAALADWYDQVYLSTDQTFDAFDTAILSESIQTQTPLAPNATYNIVRDAQIPSYLPPGVYYLIFEVDAFNNQGEVSDGNNLRIVPITIASPDLTLVTASAPASAAPGETISVTFQVKNDSLVPVVVLGSDYVSLDYANNDTYLLQSVAANANAPLAPGASYERTLNVTIPSNVPTGTAELTFFADGSLSVGESNETNNNFNLPITIIAPDLAVQNATAPASISISQTVNVSWTVKNLGTVIASSNWRDAIYLSLDDTVSANDLLLAVEFGGPLGAEDQYDRSLLVNIPANTAQGSWKLLVVTDYQAIQTEASEANNLQAIAVEVTATDLHPTTIDAVAAGSIGEMIAVTWTVKNLGPGPATAKWSDDIVLSLDDTYDINDIVLTSAYIDSQTPLPALENYTVQRNFIVPNVTPGDWKLLLVTDISDQQGELDESNNTLACNFTIGGPDLIPQSFVGPTSAAFGDAILASWEVKNSGVGPGTRVWGDNVYLSIDNVFSDDDLLLGSSGPTEIPLGIDGTYRPQISLELPADDLRAGGQYYLILRVDAGQQLAESDETNNLLIRPITLAPFLPPDLRVTSVAHPALMQAGQSVTFSFTVENTTGQAVAVAPWVDSVYLSTDGTWNNSVFIGSIQRDANLGIGGTYFTQLAFTIPNISVGSYQVLVKTDANEVVREGSHNDNNVFVSTTPVTLQAVDLIVDSTSTVSAAQSHQTIAVSWTVRNAGNAAAIANWKDRIYLSTDNTLDSGDALLAEFANQQVLASGQSYAATQSITLPHGIQGSYRLIVATDAADQIPESSAEDNNTLATSSIAVTLAPYADLGVSNVTAQTLLIGDPVDITVGWTVTNSGTGQGEIGTWIDRVVLSSNDIAGDGDDIALGEFPHDGFIPVGTSYNESRVIHSPIGTQGRFHLFVIADATDIVYEYNNNQRNTAEPNHVVDIVAREYADLVVDSVVADTSGQNGKKINVTWMVSNQGLTLTDAAANDLVYIARDPQGTQEVSYLGSFTRLGNLGAGDSYTRSAQVALPANASGQYYVFVRTGGPFEFVYTNNNDGRGTQPLNVIYVQPPQVDLHVESLAGPATAIDGDSIDVSWAVRNDGPDGIDGAWQDEIVLAPNGNLANAISLGTFTRTSGLGAGLSYARTERVRLPQRIQGLYQLFAKTDAANIQAETNENNNALGASSGLTVSIQQRPDLQATSVAAPPAIPAGGVVDVQWTVRNFGPAATPTGGSRWVDRVYVSFDNQLDSGDVLLGERQNGSALAVGESYTSRDNFALPAALSGNLYILVVADGTGVVEEYPQEGNNVIATAIAVDATVVPPPDFVATAITGPDQAFDGQSVTVRYRIENRGAGDTFPLAWTDTIWLTLGRDFPDPVRGDRPLGSFYHQGLLHPGEGYDATAQVTLPGRITGEYYLMVMADGGDAVYEAALSQNTNPDDPYRIDGNNHQVTPLSVLLTPPADLEVTAMSAPAAALGGQFVTVSWTVANRGANTTDQEHWNDLVWLSTDDSVTDGVGEAFLMYRVTHEGRLAPNASYSQTQSFQLPPSAAGMHFVVQTNVPPGPFDVPVYEGPFTSNNTLAVTSTVTNTPADLLVTSVSANASAFSGELAGISWTVRNDGAALFAGTKQWVDYLFLSPDPTFILSRATLVGYAVHDNSAPLASGASYTSSTNVHLPEGMEGLRYLHVWVDGDPEVGMKAVSAADYPFWPRHFAGQVWEGLGVAPKQNNYGVAPITINYREADLRPNAFTTTANANSGATLPVSITVINQGTRATRVDAWVDRFFLSRDTTLDTYDEEVGRRIHRDELGVNESYSGTTNITLPDDIEGDFYLLAYVDSPFSGGANRLPYPSEDQPRLTGDGMGLVHEFREEDNNVRAIPIHITRVLLPDLQATVVSGPSHVRTGQPIDISYTVQNNGAGATLASQTQWDDYVFLSRDQYLDVGSDHFLGAVHHIGGLVVGASYSVAQSFATPRGLEGGYYVFVLTDVPAGGLVRGEVFEANERNNSRVSATPTICDRPPPSDLMPGTLTIPASAQSGELVTFTWNVTNQSGESAVGLWDDALYLSTDGTWDLGDRLIGRANAGVPLLNDGSEVIGFAPRSLGPNESYSNSLQARLPIALPGNYRVIVRTDIFDDVYETSNANNKGVSTGSTSVTVKTLLLGAALDDAIAVGEERLYRVQVPAGESLEVKLTSDVKTANNELYVRYEDLPSSLAYDAAYSGKLLADQRAIVPLTNEGFYYILVRGQGGSTPTHVQARVLPFAIDNVTPDRGGDDRYVTMTISGARFSNDALVKLIRPQFGEFEPVSYRVVDRTTIVATFDLRGAPLGLYDVQVTNPDGQRARIPYRFLVEAKQPLDVTVGLGGPSQIDIGTTGIDPAIYGVSFLSLTNVDTPYVLYEYGIPRLTNGTPIPGELLVLHTSLGQAPNLVGIPWSKVDPVINRNGDLIAPGVLVDLRDRGYAGLSFSVEVLPGLTQLLKDDPHYLTNLDPLDLATLSFDFYIQAAATPLNSAEYVAYQRTQAAALRTKILADNAAPMGLKQAAADASLWVDAYLAALVSTDLLRPEDTLPIAQRQAVTESFVSILAAGALSGITGQTIIADGNLASFFESIRQWYGHMPDAFGSDVLPPASRFDFGQSSATRQVAFTVHVGAPDIDKLLAGEQIPDDPRFSDIFGLTSTRSNRVSLEAPAGAGDERFVPVGVALPYNIKLTPPADTDHAVKSVRILQQFDPSQFDARSFRLGDVQLGDLFVDLPNDRPAFTGEFDFTPSRGFVLSVSAGIDANQGVASWVFRAIDPITGEEIDSTDLGLLLQGQRATIGYSIQSVDNLLTGDLLAGSVRVVFDNEAPIDSNMVRNTIDATAPTTSTTVRNLGNGTFAIDWSARDDGLGSGVLNHTVFIAIDGGAYQPLLIRTTEKSTLYRGQAGDSIEAIVLTTDKAGNLEASPSGVRLPKIGSGVNLGTLPTPPAADELPAAPAPTNEPTTNPLFLQALLQVPTSALSSRPSSFGTVYEPFVASSFATNIPTSGANIGPLGIAYDPAGLNVFISGGAGRNNLYRFTLAGGTAATVLATLDVPIYDMAFDSAGRLWATTGGDSLVQLDPGSGQILARYGHGIQLGLAAHPNGNLFVSTDRGIEIFDTTTHQFRPFSRTQVDGLAIAPDGSVWGTTWPGDSALVKFDAQGRPTTMLDPDAEIEGLAFGQPGTALAGLLFLSSSTSGEMQMIDLVTMHSVRISSGGSRGDFLHIGGDGRIYATQSNQVVVIQPALAPRVLSVAPTVGSILNPAVNVARVIFDQDMLAGSLLDPHAVTNPANYSLTNVGTGQVFEIGGAYYNAASRTAELRFGSLPPGTYDLAVSGSIQSFAGKSLSPSFTTRFKLLGTPTSDVVSTYSLSRYNRRSGVLSVDVALRNTSQEILESPIRPIFVGLPMAQALLVNADGQTDSGAPYVDLVRADQSPLLPNDITPTKTLVVSRPLAQRLDFTSVLLASVIPNNPPVFTTLPLGFGAIDQLYSYDANANDSENHAITFLLVRAPEGASVNSATGVVEWTPQLTDGPNVEFELRAYDERGAFRPQRWNVDVTDGNAAPIIFPIANQTLSEGHTLILDITAFDPESGPLAVWMDHLPPGASYDAVSRQLRFATDGTSAGRYRDVRVYATDGIHRVSQAFEILVTNENQSPQLAPVATQTVLEGATLRFSLAATDIDGDAITFGSRDLPLGATLNPKTGQFVWTPDFDQHGRYEFNVQASDALGASERHVVINVINVNGPVTFDSSLGQFVIYEDQDLTINVTAIDPDHRAAASVLLSDGTSDSAGEGSPLVWSHTTLPAGATFDPRTQTFRWHPDSNQAGVHTITFQATDDGDGTGTNSTAQVTLTITVRDANAAPVVDAIADQVLNVGGTLSIPVRVTDVDGGPLFLSVGGLPDFATFADHGNGTGTIVANPALTDRGNYVITVIATDDGNGDSQVIRIGATKFVLSALADNSPPIMDYVGDRVALVDQTLVVAVRVRDADEDPLEYDADNLPVGATFLPTGIYGVAELRWTPTAQQIGSHTITLHATDSGNGDPNDIFSASRTITLGVRTTDQAPTLPLLATRTIAEDSLLSFNIAGSDPDGDSLIYSATNLPLGAEFDAATSVFRWKPGFSQSGTYQIQISASDGYQAATQTQTIVVTNTNQPPRFIAPGALLALENQRLRFTVFAGDLDDDTLVYSIVGALPRGASFDASTQAFAWTPDYDQAGAYEVSFRAADPYGATATYTTSIDVLDVNRAPTLPRLSGHVVQVGSTLSLPLAASDPDAGATLTWSIANLPFGASINPITGQFTWNAQAAQLGEHQLRVTVSDGALSTTGILRLIVSQTPVPPSVHIEQTPSFAPLVGQSVLLHVIAAGVADIASLSLTVDGQPLTLDAQGRATYFPTHTGRITLAASARDIDNVVGMTTAVLKVRDANDVAAPVVAFTTPPVNSILSAVTNIRANISDANLDEWTLTLERVGGTTSVIASGSANVAGGVLTALDPQVLVNGIYRLALSASDIGGRSSTTTLVLEVNSAAKAAAYTTFATDVSTTLDGVPVQIARQYNSLLAAVPSAFGVGWRLVGSDLQPASDVAVTGGETTGVFAPLVPGSRLHLNLPTGERVGYTFTPVATKVGSTTYYRPAWTADAGVTAQLTTPLALLELANGGLYQFGSGLPYHPANERWGEFAYTLTTATGGRYRYNASGALVESQALGQGKLVWSDSGVLAPSGARLNFEHDAAGRLSAVTLPDGARVTYAYDSASRLIAVNNLASHDKTRLGYSEASGALLTTLLAPLGQTSQQISYDASGKFLGTAVLAANLGTLREIAGQLTNGTLAAGQTQRYGLSIGQAELATALNGKVLIGLEVKGANGLDPAAATLSGYAPLYTRVIAGRSVALYAIDSAGALAIGVSGANSATVGNYTLNVYIGGDVNLDGAVDGVDEATLTNSLGATRDGGALPFTMASLPNTVLTSKLPTLTATTISTTATRRFCANASALSQIARRAPATRCRRSPSITSSSRRSTSPATSPTLITTS
jgi:YD repeat-containing protein